MDNSANSNFGVYNEAVLSPMDSNSVALTGDDPIEWLNQSTPLKTDNANVIGCVFIEEIKTPPTADDMNFGDGNLNFLSGISYADLNPMQQPLENLSVNLDANSVVAGASVEKVVRDDDGYGSQTAVNHAAGIMDSPVDQDTFDDFDGPFIRDRCNTWPRIQRGLPEETEPGAIDHGGYEPTHDTAVGYYARPRYVRHSPYSPTAQHLSHGSSNLSLITESTESLHHIGTGISVEPKMGGGGWMEKNQNPNHSLQYVTGTLSHHSSGGSESECQRQSQQMQPPASTSMQLHQQPQQQQQVQQQQQQQQQQTITPLIGNTNYKAGHPSYVELITQAIASSQEKRMTLSEIYDWMVTNVAAFKDQRYLHSSSGWKNSVRHNLSLHSRFKRVKRNGMDKPSWWTVDMTEETKRERNGKGRGCKQTSTNSRPRANSTTASIYHPPSKPQSGRPVVQIQQANNPLSPNFGSPNVHPMAASTKGPGQQQQMKFVSQMESTPTTTNSSMDWSQFDNCAQSVVVTLASQEEGNGNNARRKPEIALTVMMGKEQQNGSGQISTLVNQFRQNTLDEMPVMQRQLLRIQTSAGHVQQVAVPVPMPIKVVMKADKGCQTVDQGTMTSPTPTSYETMASGFWALDNNLSSTFKDDAGLSDLDIECLTAFGILGSVNDDIAAIAKDLEQSMPMPVPTTGNQHHQQVPTQNHQQHQSGQLQMASPKGANVRHMSGGYEATNVKSDSIGNGYGMQQVMMNGNDQQKVPVSQSMALGHPPTTIATPLPADLAAVDMNDALDCNIMDILSYEMNNYQQVNQVGNKF